MKSSLKVSDFQYDLPPGLIAQNPTKKRRGSRLLHVAGGGKLVDRSFTDFPACLHSGALLVLNDTRVIPARLMGRKDTGGKVEVLIERILQDERILAQVRSGKALRPGQRLDIDGPGKCGYLMVEDREGPFYILHVNADEAINLWLTRVGHVPLPPYIDRPDSSLDQERYQTVYAASPGAVAAPTAGLHLDVPMIKDIVESGVRVARRS